MTFDPMQGQVHKPEPWKLHEPDEGVEDEKFLFKITLLHNTLAGGYTDVPIMTISRLPLLISAHWLREQITASSQKFKSQIRVLDTSWLPSSDVDGYRDFYSESHIPTALHFDLNQITPGRPNSQVKFNLPDSNVFQDYVEELGISNSTHVIAYDRLDSKPSFRTWFLFRLFGHNTFSILNGGFRHWLQHGYAVSVEEPDVERGNFTPRFQPHLLRDFEHMVKNMHSKEEQVLDSRSNASFSDEGPSGGHIPNAANIPFSTLYNEDGTFKSPQELEELFKSANVDITKPMIASCLTGMTACSLVAAAHLMGQENVPLYNGSFTEWSARADPSHIGRVVKKD